MGVIRLTKAAYLGSGIKFRWEGWGTPSERTEAGGEELLGGLRETTSETLAVDR
jgi:hypothetical protein